MLALGLLLHPLEPVVVVRELVQMRERDLAGDERVVVRDVGEQVVEAVLELDVHAAPELIDVERRRRPVDPDLLPDGPGLVLVEAACRHWSILGLRLSRSDRVGGARCEASLSAVIIRQCSRAMEWSGEKEAESPRRASSSCCRARSASTGGTACVRSRTKMWRRFESGAPAPTGSTAAQRWSSSGAAASGSSFRRWRSRASSGRSLSGSRRSSSAPARTGASSSFYR